jgi:hypothetical protein
VILTLTAVLAMSASDLRDDIWDSKETREIQAKFGECAVKKNPASARRMVLDVNLSDPAWTRTFERVADRHCLVGKIPAHNWVRMTFPLDTMRYLLADALVRREFHSAVPPSIANAAPLEQPTFGQPRFQFHVSKYKVGRSDQQRASQEVRLGLIFVTQFGECVARAHPGKSHALLMTQPASVEEGTVFQQLTPEFAACLPSGQKLEFNKATLRGTIAMNFYRLAHAPRVTATPAGASK